jgi:glucan biosynthesis protein C
VGLGVLLVPIAYLAAARMLLAVRFPSTHALVDDWYNHAVYAPVFLLGFALAGARAPWETIEQLRWHALGFAVLGWVFLCVWHGLDYSAAPPSSIVLRRIWQLVFSAQIWLVIVALLGFARRHLSSHNAARRYLTTAIFPVYILHQTVIVVAAHALQPVRLDPVLEGFVLVLMTAAVCFLGYEGIRRIAVLRPLFGLAVSSNGGVVAPVPRTVT